MITAEEIKKLAHLARIEVTDDEVAGYAKDLESILGYVDQIAGVDVSGVDGSHAETNVARDDSGAREPGQYRDAMLAEAPDSEGGFYKMPKIL